MDKGFFNFDLMTTIQCSMRCAYCIEAEHFDFYTQKYTDFYNVDEIISFFKEQLELEPFKSEYTGISINFWGGEPTLKTDFIIKIVNELSNYSNRFKFYMSSNGYKIDKIIDFLKTIKDKKTINGEPLFFIQISYDGDPVQSIKRVDINGNNHTKEIKETINKLKENEIKFSLKSTITLDMLPHLYECYKDVVELAKNGYNNSYFPTIDYRTENINNEFTENLFIILKEQLFKIAKDEIPYMKEHNGNSRFSWFNYSRAECCAGNHMLAIDIDGNIYKCHGCLSNRSKKEHCIGNIKNKNINKQINYSIEEYRKHKKEKDVCSNCDAIYCLRCNSSKYDSSNKKDYWDKWFDYTSQNNLCKFYKYISNITRAVRLKI